MRQFLNEEWDVCWKVCAPDQFNEFRPHVRGDFRAKEASKLLNVLG
jgi:hypothetical protein